MRPQTAVSLFVLCLMPSTSSAGGLIGDALSAVGNVVAPHSNIGKPLDDLNRKLKKDVPVYGTVEEGASATVRNASREYLVETAGPVLAQMIQISRNDTLRGGVQDVPQQIRTLMARFYGFDVAAGIRFRIGQGGDLALASNAFRYGDADAITLYDLVVFRDISAFNDLSIWAHELQHVQQYRSWGQLDFAKRYVRDHEAVEREAYDTQARFVQWFNNGGSNMSINVSFPPVPQPVQTSGVCGTPIGACVIPASVPLGTGCWCGSANGPINGQIIGQN